MTFFTRWATSSVSLEQGWGQCYKKSSYKTFDIANSFKEKREAEAQGLSLRIYKCSICNRFHLTKKKAID